MLNPSTKFIPCDGTDRQRILQRRRPQRQIQTTSFPVVGTTPTPTPTPTPIPTTSTTITTPPQSSPQSRVQIQTRRFRTAADHSTSASMQRTSPHDIVLRIRRRTTTWQHRSVGKSGCRAGSSNDGRGRGREIDTVGVYSATVPRSVRGGGRGMRRPGRMGGPPIVLAFVGGVGRGEGKIKRWRMRSGRVRWQRGSQGGRHDG